MGLWQAFEDICAHLQAGLLRGPQARPPGSKWEEIVQVGSLFHVLPALAYCVKSRSDIAEDVREYFEAVHVLNSRRNTGILDALEPMLAALDRAAIQPILLKGAAHLVQSHYPLGTRLVGDADMLFPANQAIDAFHILKDCNCRVSDAPLPDRHRHLPVLIHQPSGLAVEVHTRIETPIANPVLPLEWFAAGHRTVAFRGLSVRVPDPTRLVSHNFVHHDESPRPSQVELRWLLDLAIVRLHHEDSIDWQEIDHFAARSGKADELATYLMFNEIFFGQKAPALTGRPRRAATRRLREHIDPEQRRIGRDVDIASHVFRGKDAEHVEGHCWRVSLPRRFLPGDTTSETRVSMLELFEDGRRLGPAYAAHRVIKEKGRGSFSHWNRELLFSTCDRADPRVKNRRYLVRSWVPASPLRARLRAWIAGIRFRIGDGTKSRIRSR